MANRYWVGGTGIWDDSNTANWSATSGGSGGASVPTSTDMVFFNSSSGGGTVKMAIYSFHPVQNFNASGFTGTFEGYLDEDNPQYKPDYRITVYPQDGTTSNIVLGTTATYAQRTNTSGTVLGPALRLNIEDPGIAPTSTLKSDGVTLYQLQINSFVQLSGTTHGFSLLDNLNAEEIYIFVAASAGFTFNTNNYTINTAYWRAISAVTGTWNFGSSTVNIGGGSFLTTRARAEFNFETSTASRPAIVNATSATFNLTSSTVAGDIYRSEVEFIGTTRNNGGHAFGTLNIINPPGQIFIVNSGGSFTNLTITQANPKANYIACGRGSDDDTAGMSVGTLTLTSYSAGYRLGIGPRIDVATRVGRQITLTVTTANLTNVDFYGIIAAGSAAPFTGAGDLGENSNINFPTGVTRYAVSAGGNWEDTSTWSTTSGGSPGASSPLPQDVAIFDANSSGEYTISTLGVQIDATDFDAVGGSIAISNGGGSSAVGDLYDIDNLFIRNQFKLRTNDITSGGRDNFVLTSSTGSFDLETYTANTVAATVSLVNCACVLNANLYVSGGLWITRSASIDANGYDVTANNEVFAYSYTSTARAIDLGGGTWTVGTWNVDSTNLTFTKSTSNIVLTGRYFTGSGLTYNSLIVQGAGTLTVSGSNTFSSFLIYRTGSFTANFEASSTQTAGDFRIRGSGGVITLESSSPPSSFGLALSTSKKIGCNFLSISYSNASPTTNTWYAGAQSTDGGNNGGWIFETLPAAGMLLVF